MLRAPADREEPCRRKVWGQSGSQQWSKAPRIVTASIRMSLAWLESATAATCHGFKISSGGEVEVVVGRIISPMKGEVQLSPVSHGILKDLQKRKVWERIEKVKKLKYFFKN